MTTEYFNSGTEIYGNSTSDYFNETMDSTTTMTGNQGMSSQDDVDAAFLEFIHNFIARRHCKDDADLYKFAFSGFGITLFSLFGIIGNILSIIVLTRPAIRSSSTSIILLGLAISDLVFVTTNIFLNGIYGFVLYFCWWSKFFTAIYPVGFPIVYPLSVTAQLCSIYFTLTVTVERFIAVYRPLMARSYCTAKNAKRIAVIVAVLSTLYCLPVWWQFTYEYGYVNEIYTHNTLVAATLGKNEDYLLYYVFWGNIIVVILGPFLTLAILNTAIYLKVRQSNQMRRNLTQSESNEVSLTKMLLTIVTIYLTCYSIGLYQRMSQVIGGLKASPHKLVEIGLFLLNVNSSINFIIYCLMGKKFRKTFIGLFEWRKGSAVSNKNTKSGDVAEIHLSG